MPSLKCAWVGCKYNNGKWPIPGGQCMFEGEVYLQTNEVLGVPKAERNRLGKVGCHTDDGNVTILTCKAFKSKEG